MDSKETIHFNNACVFQDVVHFHKDVTFEDGARFCGDTAFLRLETKTVYKNIELKTKWDLFKAFFGIGLTEKK